MRTSPRSCLSLSAVAVALCSALPSVSLALTYSALEVPGLGGATTLGYGLNNGGQVVGMSTTADFFSWPQSFSYTLPTSSVALIPGDPSSFAYGVNDSGVVVGSSYVSPSYNLHAVSVAGGTETDLGTLGGFTSVARGINAAGTIVGESQIETGETHAFVVSGGSMQDLGVIGGADSFAYAINASGTIVGTSSIDGSSAYHAFSYTGTTMADLSTGLIGSSEAKAINASGTIVGSSSFLNDQVTHACIFSGGVASDLGSLGNNSFNSWATGINDSGVIVGYSRFSSDPDTYAFIYFGGSMQNLNTLTLNLNGDILTGAMAVNNSGQILAYSSGRTYLLTLKEDPGVTAVPEPSTYGLLGAATLGAFSYLRRRRRQGA